jgi:tRNA threonylcarbamoyladenosine biosynthesis protein TsaB
MILCLETATNLCSVALCNNNGVVSLKESNESKSHASLLTVLIDKILKEQAIKAEDLDAIAVSKGPGSYTGLRIGVSVAKGIAYASSIPLLGIDTTLSMFWGFIKLYGEYEFHNCDVLYCPMIDARRMEVYYAIYNSIGEAKKEVSAAIIDRDFFRSVPENVKIVLFGDGATKLKEIFSQKNVFIDDRFKFSASNMYIPSIKSFGDHRFEDVAYFEPFYLKDFITTKPRKNILEK